MTPRTALTLAAVGGALALVAPTLGCSTTRQSELEFQELEGRDRVPRRWYRVADAVADGLARRLPRAASGRVTVVALEDRTPLIDVDLELLEERLRAAVEAAGYEVAEDPVASLAAVEGTVALVGSVTETRNPAVPSEVVLDLTAALLRREPNDWSTQAEVHRRFRVMVALAPARGPSRPRR